MAFGHSYIKYWGEGYGRFVWNYAERGRPAYRRRGAAFVQRNHRAVRPVAFWKSDTVACGKTVWGAWQYRARRIRPRHYKNADWGVLRFPVYLSGKLFKKADIFDLYKGEHVPEGSQSIAVRITLQNPDATLTDQAVDQEILKLKNSVKKVYPDISFRE